MIDIDDCEPWVCFQRISDGKKFTVTEVHKHVDAITAISVDGDEEICATLDKFDYLELTPDIISAAKSQGV